VTVSEERNLSILPNTQLQSEMLSSIFTVALLSLTALAAEQERRQATDAAQFTAAADQLISQYIPSSALPALESAVSSAASAASVTGDPLSLIYDGLLAISMPGWFSSAIPSGWSTQIAALESNINALRATSTAGEGVTVVVITTTNSAGSTFTTTSTGSIATVTTTSRVAATTYVFFYPIPMIYGVNIKQDGHDDNGCRFRSRKHIVNSDY
jgi:hypothetical protein